MLTAMGLWHDRELEQEINAVGRVARRKAGAYFASLFLAGIAVAAVAVVAVPMLRGLLLPAAVGSLVGQTTVPALVSAGVLAMVACALRFASR